MVKDSKVVCSNHKQAARWLLLNSQAPQRVRDIESYMLKLGHTYSAHILVPGWSLMLCRLEDFYHGQMVQQGGKGLHMDGSQNLLQIWNFFVHAGK